MFARKTSRMPIWRRCCPRPIFRISKSDAHEFEIRAFGEGLMDSICATRKRRANSHRRALIGTVWTTAAVLAAALVFAPGADAQRGGGGGGGGGRGQQEGATGTPGGPIYTPPSPAMNISGVWWTQSYSRKIQLVGGGDLPYTDKGKAEYAKNIAGLKDGTLKDEAR